MRTRVALGGLLIVVLSGCGEEQPRFRVVAPEQTQAPAVGVPLEERNEGRVRAPAPSSAVVGTAGAAAQLEAFPVKGRAPMTGYEREEYGQAWADVDRNGCDTRNDMLTRDLRDVAYKPGTRDCVVLVGRLAPDPYTGTDIAFERGGASEVDIDHVVALANSWATGAQFWDEPKRIAFGNDPANLLAVDAGANRQKGAGDAATWLPARTSYRCAYVARQVAVKTKYGLWVTPAEKDAMTRVLSACPQEPALDAGPLVVPPPGRGAAARRG